MVASEQEIRKLYDRYGPVLFQRCRSILGNDEDASDAVHETFARVITHHERFRADASPLTWMYRISTNYCLNQLRNRRGREEKRHVHREDIQGEDVARPGAGRWEDSHVIRRLLADADPQTQAIVIHIYFDDMTRAEAAALAGVSLPTLRKRLNHFLKRARRVLETAPVAPAAVALLVALAGWLTGGSP